jgi:integrase
MATVYKRTRRKPIPKGAETVERKGRRYAVWTSRGRQHRAPLSDDGAAVLIEADEYTVEYFDHTGKRRRVGSGTPDKDAAQRLANQLETGAMERRRGLVDVAQERFAAEARRPILDHLNAFRESLLAKGNTGRHCSESCALVVRTIEMCGAQQVGDLTPEAVEKVITSIRQSGRSLATCNRTITAVKSFSRWLRRDKRTHDNALADLARFNEATDPRHVRRELVPEEIAWLLRVTERRTLPEHEITGPDRAMVYRVALGTGFRAKELRSLTPRSFDLDTDSPAVTVQAAHSKRRRTDCQPIRQDLADLLRPWLAGRRPDERVFANLPLKTVRMLKKDMAVARAAWIADATADEERQARQRSDFLKYRNAAGEVVDFHALRHTYISSIVAGGASVKTAQELARHSTPALTIGRYSHTRLHDLRGALDSLPSLNSADKPAEPQREVLRATGTDEKWAHPGQQLGGETVRNSAEHGGSRAEQREQSQSPNVLPMNTLSENRRDTANDGRTRTSLAHRVPVPSCGPGSRVGS